MPDEWEEIKKLAADFQRAQSAGSTQKLSERNVIEIVTKLIQMNLIDVLYTCDGKEYLTHQQVLREVKDELYVSGGRISLVELSAILNVDFAHVENVANNIVKSDREVHLVLGQLVSHRYLDNMARHLNQRLQQAGFISLPSLTKEYDLPTEFLVEQIHCRLGSIIEGFKDEHDPKVIMTTSHVARNRAEIRGVLSAITVPTSVSSIIARFGFQERLFFSLAEELTRTGRAPGVMSGGRTVAKASYIPHSYAKAQNAWVNNFLASNGYLEYDAVARLGISDPVQFIKKKYKSSDLRYLSSCCVGDGLVQQIEAAVDEALVSSSWLDVTTLLPSVLTDEDRSEMISAALAERNAPSSSQSLVMAESVVVSPGLINQIIASFESSMGEAAAKDVETGVYAQSLVDGRGAGGRELIEEDRLDKKEERRKKATAGKLGGGGQGRQTNTKSVKKKGGKKKDDDWDDDEDKIEKKGAKDGKKAAKVKELEFKKVSEIEDKLREVPALNDCPEELYEELAVYLHEGLCRKYKEVAAEIYKSTLTATLQTKRRSHGDLQEKVNTIFTTIRLCEKGIQEFSSDDHKTSLSRHLLKTLGGEVVSEMFQYVAEENMIKVDLEKELTSDSRVKIINELPKEIAESAVRIHKTANGNSVGDFINSMEENSMSFCDVLLKKADKKRDRQILFGHRQQLLEQLNGCCDAALTLHMAALLIFQHFTGHMIHASGKFVPMIVSGMAGHLSADQQQKLSRQQQLVVQQMGGGEAAVEASKQLEETTPGIKELVAGIKKTQET